MKMNNDEHPKEGSPEAASSVTPPAEYVKKARACLRNGQRKQAYSVLLEASDLYPDHPVILSYCGWLQAVIDRRYKSGIFACRKAFVVFKSTNPHTMGVVYPILYLNLGRTFLAAGMKKEAVENFNKGLKHDKYHIELKKEMQLLGTREKPPVPFLSRSNPVNKYIGKMLHTTSRSSRPKTVRSI
jgi:tetratricopeptide (TPR) repeat protein